MATTIGVLGLLAAGGALAWRAGAVAPRRLAALERGAGWLLVLGLLLLGVGLDGR